MKFYAMAIAKYDGYFNTTQYFGKLTEGVYLYPLRKKQDEILGDIISYPKEGNKILILIDPSILEHRKPRERNDEFYHLCLQLGIFFKIYIAPHCGVSRPSQYKYSILDYNVDEKKNSILFSQWKKYNEVFPKYKMIFRLFGISTVELTDHIFNVMNSAVALEGLLLQGEKAENAYKFRIRGAFLLGKNYRTRHKYYTILKHAYNMRSAIVHANDKEKTKIRSTVKSDLNLNMHSFNEELIKMNRILLQQFIENPDTFKDLDDIVLKG